VTRAEREVPHLALDASEIAAISAGHYAILYPDPFAEDTPPSGNPNHSTKGATMSSLSLSLAGNARPKQRRRYKRKTTRERIARMTMERDILGKATAFFAKSQR
jgi:hypothetical protein